MKLFVQPGKWGDILSMLPLVNHQYFRDGRKPGLMVAKPYSAIFEGINYVEPFVWNGHWQDLEGALRMAKSAGTETICTATYGKEFPIEKRQGSFQLDAFDRANQRLGFGAWPLIINRRNVEREKKLVTSVKRVKPLLLFADGGESSPLTAADNLRTLLSKEFPDFNLVSLSAIRAESFLDFLGLYASASALVTIDTAHLHLSAASEVPVFAFANDQPTNWHGSAWLPRFKFHCRYADLEKRTEEFLHSLTATLKGQNQ